jgi:hypothetical protein
MLKGNAIFFPHLDDINYCSLKICHHFNADKKMRKKTRLLPNLQIKNATAKRLYLLLFESFLKHGKQLSVRHGASNT